jgi:hypothetical protein
VANASEEQRVDQYPAGKESDMNSYKWKAASKSGNPVADSLRPRSGGLEVLLVFAMVSMWS